jgi:hypothetical protein
MLYLIYDIYNISSLSKAKSCYCALKVTLAMLTFFFSNNVGELRVISLRKKFGNTKLGVKNPHPTNVS